MRQKRARSFRTKKKYIRISENSSSLWNKSPYFHELLWFLMIFVVFVCMTCCCILCPHGTSVSTLFNCYLFIFIFTFSMSFYSRKNYVYWVKILARVITAPLFSHRFSCEWVGNVWENVVQLSCCFVLIVIIKVSKTQIMALAKYWGNILKVQRIKASGPVW